MAHTGQKVAGETPAGPRRGARQQNPRHMHVKVRLVYAHNTILHVRFADMKMRYVITGETPKWMKTLVEHVKEVGRHRIVKRYNCSKVTRLCGFYNNDVYEAEIALAEFIKLITAVETWKRSTVARKIVEKINELVSGYE